jgi:hypothetical protein
MTRASRSVRTGSLLVGALVATGCAATLSTSDGGQPTGDEDGGRADARMPGDGGALGADARADTAPDAMIEEADAGPTMVDVFVAVGHGGRTTISCDDGRTWIHDRSDEPTLRCSSPTPPSIDCDHHAGAGRGIVFASDAFVATFGWGAPGSIRRSTDGVTWERIAEGTNYGNLAYEDHWLLGAHGGTGWSDDDARTWTIGPYVEVHPRRTGIIGGVFIAAGDGDTRISSDRGVTWRRPTELPEGCWGRGLIATGNGVALMILGAYVCRSTDLGETWTRIEMGDAASVGGEALWTGEEFVALGGDATGAPSLMRSTDGETWTAEPVRMDDGSTWPTIGAFDRGASGTYVAVNAEWQGWYERQHFYRSDDGITWSALPEGSFTGSHPINDFAHGRIAAGTSCP